MNQFYSICKRHFYSIFILSILLPSLIDARSPVLINGWNVSEEVMNRKIEPVRNISANDLLLITLDHDPESGSKDRLTKSGIQIVAFIPRRSFLVRIVNPSKSDSLFKKIQSAYYLQPLWKIETSLTQAPPPGPGEEIPLAIYTVERSIDLNEAIASAGGVVTSIPDAPLKNRLGVIVPSSELSDFLDKISRRKDVYSIEPASGAVLLNDNASAIVQSGNTSSRPLWDRGLRGEGQTVCVLDTGLDFDSCYFAEDDGTSPPMATGYDTGTPDYSRKKVVMYDLLYSADFDIENGDFDNQGHGTAVAGNALGSRLSDPFGVTVSNGMAPAAKIIVQDGGFTWNDCADLPALGCPVIDLTPVLNQAIAQGANVHNNSWGDRENFTPKNLYTAPTADMDDATWRNPEFLIVCAAGNNGSQGNDTVLSPSVGKNVLSVGAAQSPTFGGNFEYVTSFSSRGWAADGRIKPDLIAPGQTVSASSDKNISTGNCGTASIQGTSMASPVTAGCACLVRQYFTEGWYPSGTKLTSDSHIPSAALIKAILLNGAEDMTGVVAPVPNRIEGWGRVNLEKSLYFNGDLRKIIATDNSDHFTTTTQPAFETAFQCYGNTAGGDIKITLVWTDYPADPVASISLVNDLDLRVIEVGEGGTEYLGNNFDSSGLSVSGGFADTTNNVEMVILPASTTGIFKVRIEPSLIIEEPQGFVLVIGGDVVERDPSIPVTLSTYSLE